VPRRVHVVQDLPRTVDGKVARHRLAAGVAGG
jgi:acyl-coenzyme A synthetase/AMP-(fatty) acid ligase